MLVSLLTFEMISDEITPWLVPGVVCQVLLHLSLVPGELQGKGEQEKPQRVTQRGGGLGISGQLQTRCALRERAVFD